MGFFSDLGKGINALFGSDPSQYVEESDWEGFKGEIAIGIKDKLISKKDAEELMGAYKVSFIERVKIFAKKIEDSIRLLPSERENSTIQKAKIDLKNDEMIKPEDSGIRSHNNHDEEEKI